MEVQRDTGILAGRTMTQPQQHYDVTDDDFDFIWKNIDSPLVVRDRINVIKTRSHPYQSERDTVLERLKEWSVFDESITAIMITRSNKWWHTRFRNKIEELRAGE